MNNYLPNIPGNSPAEIKANGERILSQLDAKHQAELKALEEIHQENMNTLDEYFKEIDKAKAEKDFSKVAQLMRDMNKIISQM